MNREFYEGCFGLERETLRIDSQGRLAQTPHPFGDSEEITRDFCENQLELVTPVCRSIDEVMEQVRRLDGEIRRELEKRGETIWLYSSPPFIEGEAEIPVANFTGDHVGKRLYREQLERRYGKKLMLFSGIHFNFSFSEDHLRSICDREDYEDFRERFYLKLYKHLSCNSWLLLALTAVSPAYDKSLDEVGARGGVLSRYSSIRNGERGYWNEFVPVLDFTDLDSFVRSIQWYVTKGVLFSASELYLPVRLKPRGINKLENFKKGISHVELRMFDLNPFEELGIDQRDLEFAHLLVMYLSGLPDFDFTPELQEQAVRDHQAGALYDLDGVTIGGVPLLDKARDIIGRMEELFREDGKALEVLEFEKGKLTDRLCTRISAEDIYK